MILLKFLNISQQDFNYIKRAGDYLIPHKKKLLIIFCLMILNVLFNLIQPYCFGKIVANLIYLDKNILINAVTILIVTYILLHTLQFIQAYLSLSVSNEINYNVTLDMHKKILNIPIFIFDKMRVGEFISRIIGDSNTISYLLTTKYLNILLDLLKLVIVGIAACKMSWKLFLVNLLIMPISFLITNFFGKKLRKKNEELAKTRDSIYSVIQENVSGVREIKYFGVKNQRNYLFSNINLDFKNLQTKTGLIQILMNCCNGILGHFSELVTICIGFYLVYSKQIRIEHFIAYTSYAAQFFDSLSNLIGLNAVLQEAMVSFKRIFDVFDDFNQKSEIFGLKEIDKIYGNIDFKNVSFAYSENKYVVRDVSLRIPLGKKVALVGKSGSGKSTLINLLLRNYEIEHGTITIGDTDIRELTERSLRKEIAVVPQEPFFFNASILENILIANPTADIKLIEKCCKEAYIHDYIMKLPKQYNTLLGERGINLSGGQKQRIAIARAFAKECSILIFDEATSSLDNESQHMIKMAFTTMVGKKTIIIITHRLFTIFDSDIIYVIDKGNIVGKGNHHSLLSENKIYKKLYNLEMLMLKQSYKDK